MIFRLVLGWWIGGTRRWNPPTSPSNVVTSRIFHISLHYTAKTATTSIVIHPKLVPNLTPTPPPSELPAFHKPPIEINANRTVIDDRSIQVLHTVLCVLAGVVHHETEPAGRHLLLVQTHDDALHVTSLAKHLMYLVLRRVK